MYEQLIQEVMERMGGATDAEARRAIDATLMTLGERMRSVDARAVADALPHELGERVLSFGYDPGLDLDGFYARVARREGVSLGFAREHAQAVCHSLCSALSEQARAQLCIDVWPELVRPMVSDGAISRVIRRRASTLASGRPSSERPLSEAV